MDYLEACVRTAGFSVNDGIVYGGMSDAKRLVEKYEAIIEEQKLTIESLNSCIGGEGSTTTENLVGFSKFENSIRAPLQAKIDRLMLEYCPEEMTQDQLDTWAENQKPIDDNLAAIVNIKKLKFKDIHINDHEWIDWKQQKYDGMKLYSECQSRNWNELSEEEAIDIFEKAACHEIYCMKEGVMAVIKAFKEKNQ